MTESNTPTVGEMIVRNLESRGVNTVFGIPGVHTVELYRGLARSGIRHVTARHEQGAGFMADGYARVSGRPGVAFIITGPGMSNILTPMMQAGADSIPMLVVSSVNEEEFIGRGLGHLHEMPDQAGICRLAARHSEHVSRPGELLPALDRLYAALADERPGPVHLQVPLDVMGMPFEEEASSDIQLREDTLTADGISAAQALLNKASRPLIIAGGGALAAEAALIEVAERLQALVVQTINARGLMYGHVLKVPASPSLEPIRELMREADAVLAIGTELGPTDFDAYRDDAMPAMKGLVRIDICAEQLQRHDCAVALQADAAKALEALLPGLGSRASGQGWGAERAAAACTDARAALSPAYRHQVELLECIRDSLPGAIIVGDSTQPVYAGNLYYGHDRPGGWFNSSVGYGALGYAIPAAIGAALADPSSPVISLTGDGGAQFTLPELMVAVDEKLPVTFLVWNNFGYREIETSMADAGVEVVGCDPTPPDFAHIAAACGMPHRACAAEVEALAAALKAEAPVDGPRMIEIRA